MGIKGLTSLLKKYSPACIQTRKLYDYKGKSVAIDVSLFMHKFMYNYGNLIGGFFDQIYHLRRRGISPIYVFDGKPPQQKNKVLECRKKAKTKLASKITELECKLVEINKRKFSTTTEQTEPIEPIEPTEPTDPTEPQLVVPDVPIITLEEEQKNVEIKLKKLNRQVFKITSNDYRNIRKLFDLLNVPYYDAEGEADTLCVYLTKNNLADVCMTEDMDFLTHGCVSLLRDFNSKSNTVTEYNLTSILHNMGITHTQFIDLCILCGCDYTYKIRGLGPIGAFKLIKNNETIETILTNFCGPDKKYKLPEDFDYENARRLFLSSNTAMNYKSHYSKEVDLVRLGTFLSENTKLTPTQINNRFKKIF